MSQAIPFTSLGLTPDQISQLQSVSETVLQNPYQFNEVYSLIRELGFNTALEYLELHPNYPDLIFNSPLMSGPKINAEIYKQVARNKIKLQKGEKCRRCGSENTISVGKQTRSLDEPTTVFTTCLTCQNKWKN